MKTIFDKSTRNELIGRIHTLNETNQALWGKMNVHQMTKHCMNWDKWILGKNHPTYKQEFIGWVFGKMALKSILKDDRPMKKNMPSGKAFEVKDTEKNVATQKNEWADLIAEYEHFSNPGFVHDFFGKMTKEQIGLLAYKHSDHHLRQFGA